MSKAFMNLKKKKKKVKSIQHMHGWTTSFATMVDNLRKIGGQWCGI